MGKLASWVWSSEDCQRRLRACSTPHGSPGSHPRHGADEDLRLIAIFNRPAPNVTMMLLVMASGAILAAGRGAGLYLLLPASIVAFISGVLNAWFFLLPPPEGRRPGRADTRPRRRRDSLADRQADGVQ